MDLTQEEDHNAHLSLELNGDLPLDFSTDGGIPPYYNLTASADAYDRPAPAAPLADPQVEEPHQFVGGVNVAEPASSAPVDLFPLDDSAQQEFFDADVEDNTSMATDEYEKVLSEEIKDLWPLMSVATEIPDPFGTNVLAKDEDLAINIFSKAFYRLKESFDQATSLKEKADLYESVRSLWEEWQYLWANHIILAPKSLDQFVHVLRVKIPPFLAYVGYAHNSLPTTKPKIKNYEKNATVFIVREPAPCAANAKADVGSFIFEIVLRPGITLTKPTTVRATSVACQYADWDTAEDNGNGIASRGAAGKDTAPLVTHSALTHVEDNLYMVEQLSFNTTSSGRVFEVDFHFMFYYDDAETKRASTFEARVRSLPMACLSNIGSQWASGEGRYVANLAFGMCNTKAAPQNEIRYPALANAVQFAHLTCTRQIGSAHFIAKLAARGDEAKRHFGRKKTNATSLRSANARLHLDLHNSFVSYSRVLRILTVDEIRSIFPPTSVAQAVNLKLKANGGAFTPETLPAPHAVDHNGFLEFISYDSFCKNWKWFGALMYKLYTGQIEGVEIRSLWLRGIIHLVPPPPIGSPTGILSLNPNYGLGTALIRTSRTEGTFTYAFVQARTGDPFIDYVCKPVEVSGNDYSSTLHNEGAIHSLVNIMGVPILKDVVVRAYKAITVLPPIRDSVQYTRNLATIPQLAGSFGNMNLSPSTPSSSAPSHN